MESFETFYEKFSFNPRDWFRSPEVKRKLRMQEIAIRSFDRRHARENIKKLKDLLKSKGYIIHKSDYSYTVRKDRKVGLSNKDIITNDMNKYQGSLSIPYIRTLFTLAHEVGHVLQWTDNDKKERFDEFFKQQMETRRSTPWRENELLHLHKMYYELDAWVKGMEFIPVELKPQYKKYAYDSYKTYMKKLPKHYNGDILLRNLLYKLNFEEQ